MIHSESPRLLLVLALVSIGLLVPGSASAESFGQTLSRLQAEMAVLDKKSKAAFQGMSSGDSESRKVASRENKELYWMKREVESDIRTVIRRIERRIQYEGMAYIREERARGVDLARIWPSLPRMRVSQEVLSKAIAAGVPEILYGFGPTETALQGGHMELLEALLRGRPELHGVKYAELSDERIEALVDMVPRIVDPEWEGARRVTVHRDGARQWRETDFVGAHEDLTTELAVQVIRRRSLSVSLLAPLLEPGFGGDDHVERICRAAIDEDCADCVPHIVPLCEATSMAALAIDRKQPAIETALLAQLDASQWPELAEVVADHERRDLARRILIAQGFATDQEALDDAIASGDALVAAAKGVGPRSRHMLSLLLLLGADPDPVDPEVSPLLTAAGRGRLDLYLALRRAGAEDWSGTAAELLWQRHDMEKKTTRFTSGPGTKDLLWYWLPRGTRAAEGGGYYCCGGMYIELTIAKSRSVIRSRLFAERPSVETRDTSEGGEQTRVSGYRGCYGVDVTATVPPELTEEGRALARVLFERVQPPACFDQTPTWMKLTIPAMVISLLLAALIVLRPRSRARSR